MCPSREEIDDTLRRLERPRIEIVSTEWQSDAEREGLPVVNTTTGSGAPLLDRDRVLKWEPTHLGRK